MSGSENCNAHGGCDEQEGVVDYGRRPRHGRRFREGGPWPAGRSLVASGRDTNRLSKALGASSTLLTVKLDVTRPADAEAAVKAAVDRFGRIDVLINNAASFFAGYFEELTPEQMEPPTARRASSDR